MFTVEDIDDTVARLRAHGAELVGEVVQYEDKTARRTGEGGLQYCRGTVKVEKSGVL